MGPLRGASLSGRIKSPSVGGVFWHRRWEEPPSRVKSRDASLKRGVVYPRTWSIWNRSAAGLKTGWRLGGSRGRFRSLSPSVASDFCPSKLRTDTHSARCKRLRRKNGWFLCRLSLNTLECIPSLCVCLGFFFPHEPTSCELLNITFLVNNSFLFF